MQKELPPSQTMLLAVYPASLIEVLHRLSVTYGPFYLSGGSVRDCLCGREAKDLDITMPTRSRQCCHDCIAMLGGGAFVELGTDEEEAARCVWRGWVVDFCSFRKDAVTIEDDLKQRDFTINAMALPLFADGELLDPLGGQEDLKRGVLSPCPGALEADPLRMLRGFRFSAQLGFSFSSRVLGMIARNRGLLTRSAVERIQHEMDLIMECTSAAQILRVMADCGLLWQLYPELERGDGLEQAGFHHLDVFGHSLLALEKIEAVFADGAKFFPEHPDSCEVYLAVAKNRRLLRWAALFHDLGKPVTRKVFSSGAGTEDGEKPDKMTFYNHDEIGKKLFLTLAERFRWSRADSETVALLIGLHMSPFHLCSSQKKEGVSRKAFLRLYKKGGGHLPGLFTLAMADLLASRGPLREPGMEGDLARLYGKTMEVIESAIVPVVTGAKLLGGDDLITKWKLSPGPLFREILDGIELAQVEGQVINYEEAAAWVDNFLAQKSSLSL